MFKKPTPSHLLVFKIGLQFYKLFFEIFDYVEMCCVQIWRVEGDICGFHTVIMGIPNESLKKKL